MKRLPAPAPGVPAPDSQGNSFSLQELRGSWVVLYFYPKDESIGCTRQACGFRDTYADLRAEGAVVVGVSPDSNESHNQFARRHRLPFKLVTDKEGTLRKAYGTRGRMGLTRRVTFLIDPQGQIAKRYRVLRWKSHAKQVLNDIRALKTAAARQNRNL